MIDAIIIVIYLVSMLIIGLYFVRKQKNEDSFFLANRNLSFFHVVASIFSTVAGAGTIFTVAALGFTYGISAIWFFIAALVGFIIFAMAVPKIRAIADKNDCITLPELIGTILDRRCVIISSIVTIGIFGGLVAVNFLAAGNILRILFDLNLMIVVIGFAIIVTLYSLMGGFRAVIWTDIIQMVIIIIGICIILVLAINAAGGLNSLSSLPESHKDIFNMGPALIIGLFVSTVLAYFSSQDIYQRIFAAKDIKTAKKSTIWMGIVLVIVGSLVLLTGIFGRILFADALPGEILAVITQNLVPVGLAGIVLAALLSMANSTADSEMLTVTSNIMRDFGKNKKISNKQEVKTSRTILVIVAIIALIFALSVRNIIDLILSMYTWLGILGLNIIAALFWKKTSARAYFYSVLVGFVLAIVYAFGTGDFENSIVIGLIPSFFILVIISLIDGRRKVNLSN